MFPVMRSHDNALEEFDARRSSQDATVRRAGALTSPEHGLFVAMHDAFIGTSVA
jgi:hypothetical protein